MTKKVWSLPRMVVDSFRCMDRDILLVSRSIQNARIAAIPLPQEKLDPTRPKTTRSASAVSKERVATTSFWRAKQKQRLPVFESPSSVARHKQTVSDVFYGAPLKQLASFVSFQSISHPSRFKFKVPIRASFHSKILYFHRAIYLLRVVEIVERYYWLRLRTRTSFRKYTYTVGTYAGLQFWRD